MAAFRGRSTWSLGPYLSRATEYATSWNGVPVRVTCRIIGRYGWTTATIDVAIDGAKILATGGVMKFAATHEENFDFRQSPHRAKVGWGRGAIRSLPFTLTIDDALVADARVPIQNWWIALWPCVAVVVGFAALEALR